MKRVIWLAAAALLLAGCAEPEAGVERVSEVDGMVQVYVPAGEFVMGNSLGAVHESPKHTVYLDGYWIDQTEVTNAMFAQFVAATGHVTTAEVEGISQITMRGQWGYEPGADWQHPTGPESDIEGLDEHPVVHVSWADAAAYCEWAGRRLPTEAEWEKAARGTDERRFPWGDEPVAGIFLNMGDATLNSHYSDYSVDDGWEHTSPVGFFTDGVSPYGAYDMVGNVWEWVADWYSVDYYRSSPYENPAGPEEGEWRVVRGGSWNERSNYTRTAARHFLNNPAYIDVGFRCADD